MKKNKKILIAFLAFLILDLSSSQNEYYDYFRSPTFSDYGTVGLLNMPSARTLDEGSLAFHWSRTQPYLRGSIVATPFSWFEALYKYTDINDKLYSPIRSFSGGQSLKDKAFDAKFILLFENEYLPQLAVGFRDLGGTNRFASEYLVASKAVKNFDFTIGMGWGKLAGRNNLSNPLTNLNNRFDVRGNSGERGTGGKLSTDAWFSGEKASIFGGFEYFPKFYPRLRLKLEYDSTDFDTEGERPVVQKSPVNFGISYKLSRTIDIHAGYVRGNTLQMGFTFKGTFRDRDPYKIKKDPPILLDKKTSTAAKIITSRDERSMYLLALRELQKNQIYLQSAEIEDDEIHVVYSQRKFNNIMQAAGRSSIIIDSIASEKIQKFRFSSLNGPNLMSTVTIPRDEFTRSLDDKDFQSLKYVAKVEKADIDFSEMEYVPKASFPVINYEISPEIRSHIGGPDAFYFGQAWIRGDFNITFSRKLSVNGILSANLFDNFDNLRLPSDSQLPRVRTEIVDYLKDGSDLSISRLQFNYLDSISRDLYTRLSIGYFEEMYGGFAFEALYRPFTSPFAIGIEVYDAKKRNFDQKFGFQDYDVVSGHINTYYKHAPSGVLVTMRGGRFLAKDSGITLDFSRRFKSGMYVGAFFTLTDVSEEEFGEGSFDKGFYFSLPIEIFSREHAPGRTFFGLKPLTRDGGASVISGMGLYGITDQSSRNNLLQEWDTFYE